MSSPSFSDSKRLNRLRQLELDDDDRKLISDVAEYGCHIIHVSESSGIPGWSYTIGVFETLKQPELIVVGVNSDLGHFVLNESVRLMREGQEFRHGDRKNELLDQVECEFRRVEERWPSHVMNYTNWFYGGDQFPVLQCVYPDLDGHFPWDPGFDATWRDRQALLFLRSEEETAVERDFWAASDPDSSLSDWKFEDPPHTGVYTTKKIIDGEEPVLYVSHDSEDGAWQFHGVSESTVESAALTCFHHIVDADPSIKQLIDLPPGSRAWRDKPEDPWMRDDSDRDS